MGGDGSGRPKKIVLDKLIKEIMPVDDVFDEAELKMYNELLHVYVSDFDSSDLTSSDMDDIINLAMNKVLSFRLLKDSKGSTDRQLDIATAIEKMDKRSDRIKENLSTRRRDRINPNDLKGFSIVDLAVAHDQDAKRRHEVQMNKMRKEEQDILDKRKDYLGNRYDTSENSETSDEDNA